MEKIVKLTCLTCQNSFEIDEEVQQFACASCGTEYLVKRSGGMVRLAKAAIMDERARLRKELEQLELALKAEMECEMGGMPGYQLLRFDYAKIGKLHLQFAAVAPEKLLLNIFTSLTADDFEKLAHLYAANPDSPTGTWIRRVRDLNDKIIDKKKRLNTEETQA
jgi:DNA-directed RNA polymerase subunit RPC12/RpoP